MRRESQVLTVIETDIGDHRGQDRLRWTSDRHREGLPLEVTDRTDPFRREQLGTADVDAGQKDDGPPLVDLLDEWHAVPLGEVHA